MERTNPCGNAREDTNAAGKPRVAVAASTPRTRNIREREKVWRCVTIDTLRNRVYRLSSRLAHRKRSTRVLKTTEGGARKRTSRVTQDSIRGTSTSGHTGTSLREGNRRLTDRQSDFGFGNPIGGLRIVGEGPSANAEHGRRNGAELHGRTGAWAHVPRADKAPILGPTEPGREREATSTSGLHLGLPPDYLLPS